MSKIKLTGENSGYVEISAGQNAGNNTLETPTSGTRLVAHEGSQDVTLNANLTVNGVLTYDDVTNIDSVGVITARAGVNVTGGSVGIGTDAPTAGNKLHLHDTSACRIHLTTDSTGHTSSDGTRLMVDSSNNFEILNRENANIEFFTNNTERLRITSAGNVGIGLTNPDWHLDIKSTSVNAVVRLKSTGSTNGGQLQVNSDDLILRNRDAGNLQLWTNDAEKFRITSSGDLFVAGTGGMNTTQLPNGSTINVNGTSSNDGLSVIRYSTGYGAYGLNIGRSKSNTIGTNAAVTNGNDLGHITFYGADGTDFNQAAMITAQVDGTPSDGTDMPGRLVFKTSSDGSATPTERFRIHSDGTVEVNPGNTTSSGLLIIGKDGSGEAQLRFSNASSNTASIRLNSSEELGVFYGGSEKLHISSNGYVGVNCTPLSWFQVKTSTNANIALSADGSEASIEAYNDAGSANVPLRIRGSEIKFKIDGTQRARLSYSSSSAVFSLGDESNSAGHIRLEAKASENQIHGRSNHPISFLINTGEKLKLHTSGLLEGKGAQFTANVTPSSGRGVEIFEAATGVGQISAYNRDASSWDELRLKGSEVRLYSNNGLRLDVQNAQSYLYGTSDGILNLDTTDGRGSFIRFKENGTTKAWVGCAEGMGGGTHSPDQDDLGLRATGNIIFSANGGERLRINENGEIEVRSNAFITINEASPSGNYFQEIAYAPNDKGCLYLENFAYYGSQPALVINDQDTNNARNMEDVQFHRAGTMRGYIRIYPGSVTYSTSGSDIRLKKNFEDWTEDNLSKFKTLSPKLFNWIDDEDGTEKTKGFIAQDNLDKFPEAYDLTASTDRYYFNPSGMVHYMMKALQEAATKIETLEARIAALE